MISKLLTWAKSPRSIVAALVGVWVAFASAAAGLTRGDTPPVVILGSFLIFLFVWGLAYFAFGFVRNTWERRTWPPTPAFARPTRSSGARTMLREDHNARFFSDRQGFLFQKRLWFVGTGCPPVEISSQRFEFIRKYDSLMPIAIVEHSSRKWWVFEGSFLWENEGYLAEDVKALVLQRSRDRRRRLERAHALMAVSEGPAVSQREGIPQEVKLAVWKRDGGRCSECGRGELLEFDHIIPFSFGGSSSVKNLQLLCADCNRAKGASL